MSETVVLPSGITGTQQREREETPPAAISLGSFAALLLELAFTRLFSVILFYHFAFLAISIALLGLGAGGVSADVHRRWLARFQTRALGAAICVVNAVAIPVVLEIVLHVPVSLDLSEKNFLKLTTLYVSSAIPFFLTGCCFRWCLLAKPVVFRCCTAPT